MSGSIVELPPHFLQILMWQIHLAHVDVAEFIEESGQLVRGKTFWSLDFLFEFRWA